MPRALRRLRRSEPLRRLVREVSFDVGDLIYPVFVKDGIDSPEPISSMPGIDRLPMSAVADEARGVLDLGIGAVLIFGIPVVKDERASESFNPNGVVSRAVEAIKRAAPNLVVMTDVCVCSYTTHGHCGVLKGECVDNADTLPLLAKVAICHARAGADVVAPSSMMDGQVEAIRSELNTNRLEQTAIMAYSSKFASGFYGPFREAADSLPGLGDRSSYQHDFANPRHAARELLHDEEEGADILMVKPGLAYLDIVKMAREISDLPIAAYSVSGEYSMIKAAAERGWLDERRVVLETLTAFKRAGADLIITYQAKEAAQWLNES